jgi:hypothetical protein
MSIPISQLIQIAASCRCALPKADQSDIISGIELNLDLGLPEFHG